MTLIAQDDCKVRVNRQGREERQEVIHHESHEWRIREIRADSWFKSISSFLGEFGDLGGSNVRLCNRPDS